MTALQWIIKEAKSLRRKYPHRYDRLKNPWRDGYMKQASAIYASTHKGKSPVGHKKPKKMAAKKTTRKRTRRRVGELPLVSGVRKTNTVAHMKKRLRDKLEGDLKEAFIRKENAKTKRLKKKHQKKISELRTEIRKLK